MSIRSSKLTFKGQVEQRHEANRLLTEPGAAVLVFRGVARSITIVCPDGCGEQLTINLDPRTGPAWRFFNEPGARVSLYPSVWRDTGCKSHFIVWNSRVYWCDRHEGLAAPGEDVKQKTLAALTTQFLPYQTLAERLSIVPWAVLSACDALCRSGQAEVGAGNLASHYRRKTR
jgi:hypothetical protein